MLIDRAIAEKVLDVVNAGLVSGLGKPEPGRMCVEAAVCYAMGLPHGDNPSCVAPALRRLKISLNDRSWSSNQARAQGLRRLAIAQLGSAGVLDETEFRRRVVDMTIRKVVPIALLAAASRNPKHAEALEAAAVRCEQEGTREACWHAREIADAAAYAADASASAYAYAASADAYASAAYAYAASAASAYAADAASDDAASDASAYAADAADAYATAASAADARDRVLAQFAEWVVEILIDLQAPGCQFLDLVPKEAA